MGPETQVWQDSRNRILDHPVAKLVNKELIINWTDPIKLFKVLPIINLGKR
jgi:hypothetical protein